MISEKNVEEEKGGGGAVGFPHCRHGISLPPHDVSSCRFLTAGLRVSQGQSIWVVLSIFHGHKHIQKTYNTILCKIFSLFYQLNTTSLIGESEYFIILYCALRKADIGTYLMHEGPVSLNSKDPLVSVFLSLLSKMLYKCKPLNNLYPCAKYRLAVGSHPILSFTSASCPKKCADAQAISNPISRTLYFSASVSGSSVLLCQIDLHRPWGNFPVLKDTCRAFCCRSFFYCQTGLAPSLNSLILQIIFSTDCFLSRILHKVYSFSYYSFVVCFSGVLGPKSAMKII